jgi:Domain of unknown function (DUF4440)
MSSMLKSIVVAPVSITFALCAAFASNSNANPAKPAPVAPTADELLALDKQATEAYINGNGQFFEGLLSEKIVMTNDGHRMGKADVIKMISGVRCNIKDWSLTEPHMERINDDTYVLSYKATVDGTCTSDGKTDQPPSPVRAATVWMRNGEKWQAAFHGENLIVDPKTLSETYKKEESEKGDLKKDTAAVPHPAKRIYDSGTDGLLTAEKAIWGAWKEKNAKKLEHLTAADITFVNIFGTYFANKADVIKDWTGATCHVKSFSMTDGVGTLVSPTVGILTVTGSIEGDCGGQKPPSVYGASVYVKDGGAWKWAFGFNSPH